ncbi:MAG: SAM hydroxide adenosyltransferase [Verrucomicrobiota bacterium]
MCRHVRVAVFIALLTLGVFPPGSRAAPPTLSTGEIDGAKFALAVPENWNHRVLIIAHGLRPLDRPLVADLYPDQPANKALLSEGWLIAKTSYRRNGLIVADAIADIDALRGHITANYGVPERVLLEGESMGGLIVTLLAERPGEKPPPYAGVVAIGAALNAQEPGSINTYPNQRPLIPLIFLTNQSELDGPLAYVNAPIVDPDHPRPVLWRVSRDGHVNVNQPERLAALRALNAWLDHGPKALPNPSDAPKPFDATLPPEKSPSQVSPDADGRGFHARVVEVSAVYGNVFLNVQPTDLETAGIAKMTRFLLTVGDQTFRVLYGRDFSSVKRSDWVLFPNADGYCWLARNFADAAAAAKLGAGDSVWIRRIDSQTPTALPPPRTQSKFKP